MFIKGFGKKTQLFKDVKKIIDEDIRIDEMKYVKKAKKQKKANALVSEKFFPPSSRKDTLFIVEGLSAQGGILQRRNSKTDGSYALRKNEGASYCKRFRF